MSSLVSFESFAMARLQYSQEDSGRFIRDHAVQPNEKEGEIELMDFDESLGNLIEIQKWIHEGIHLRFGRIRDQKGLPFDQFSSI